MSDWKPIDSAPRDGTWILLRGHNSIGIPIVPVVAAYNPIGSMHVKVSGWLDSGTFKDVNELAHELMPMPS